MRDEAQGNNLLEGLLSHPVLQNVVDRVVDRVQDSIDRGVDRIAGKMDQYAAFATMYAQRMSQQQQQQSSASGQSPPPPPPKPEEKEDPRMVLCFGPDEQLTEEKIKARRRELAKIVHTDKGGDTEAMQRINVAADALLKEIA